MAEKVTITKIFTKDEISPRTNKPYTKMSIKTTEYGDRWISGFKNKGNAHWKEGDSVEIILEKKASNGKEYLNYSLPNVNKENLGQLAEILRVVTMIAEKQGIDTRPQAQTLSNKADEPDDVDYPDEEINLEDIPF